MLANNMHLSMPTAMGYLSHIATGGMTAHQNYYGQQQAAQKRWQADTAIATMAALSAGHMIPGSALTDVCVVALSNLLPNAFRGGERALTLGCYVQGLLDASAVSAEVVMLALYYLRQTSSMDKFDIASAITSQSAVIDATGMRVDGGEIPSVGAGALPTLQLRVRLVAALTCAHKFNADAAYTTRTWAELGALDTPMLVRAERELLAQLSFELRVSPDNLQRLREEVVQWMSASIGYEKPHQDYSYHHHGQRFPGSCNCASCSVYTNGAIDTISPSTSPVGSNELWSPMNSAYPSSFDMSWPTTPTGHGRMDDYFSTASYHYASAAAAANANASYFALAQAYRAQPSSPPAYSGAQNTVIAMPEPQTAWSSANGCYPSQMSATAAAEYASVLDSAFPSHNVMPQPAAFYAY